MDIEKKSISLEKALRSTGYHGKLKLKREHKDVMHSSDKLK